jgi:protein-tyrosine-phosphatase
MAVGLARELLGNLGVFESAGISPGGPQANDKAIEVIHEMGIDIRDHCSRRVSSLNLNDFDFIIAMDSTINNQIKSLLPDASDKIVSWDVDDPFGKDIGSYRKCAETIRSKVLDFRKILTWTEVDHP